MKLVMTRGHCPMNDQYEVPESLVLEGVTKLACCPDPTVTSHSLELHFKDTKSWVLADRATGWDLHPNLKNVAIFTPLVTDGGMAIGTSTEDLELLNWAHWELVDDDAPVTPIHC